MKNNYFSYCNFDVLAHVSAPLLALITFRSVLLLSLGEIQKSNMADPRWPPLASISARKIRRNDGNADEMIII